MMAHDGLWSLGSFVPTGGTYLGCGGLALVLAVPSGTYPSGATVSLTSVSVTNNSATDASGGGVCILTPVDLQSTNVSCATPAQYWPWQHNTGVLVADSTLVGNTALCSVCSGGGLWLSSGGSLTLSNTTLWANAAGQFGGGLALGVGGAVSPTCGLVVEGGSLGANFASHGGAQLYMSCPGDVLLNAPLHLSLNSSQVGSLPAPCLVLVTLLRPCCSTGCQRIANECGLGR